MASKAEDITRYRFDSSDRLLLDANIWLSVYGPQRPGDRRVAVYSSALDNILKAGSRVHIDVLVMSEFINTYARLKWQILAPSSKFKEFRNSLQFESVAQDIAADARLVLKNCIRVDDRFELIGIDALLNEYAAGHSDFNDQVLAELCARNGLKIVTDDGDFRGCGIPVITANRRLLS